MAITAGCNLAFSMAMAVIAGGGRVAVILPVPWYFNHRMALEMQGIPAIPLPCRAEDGFLPDPARIEPLLAAGARALVLVSPEQPDRRHLSRPRPSRPAPRSAAGMAPGWCWTRPTATSCPPRRPRRIALFQDPAWRDGIVHLYSFSKAYCVPGHRVGAIVAGPAFRAELMKALDTWQICAAAAGPGGAGLGGAGAGATGAPATAT